MTASRLRRLVCITDVPTPYRNHLFSAMTPALAARGFDFEVCFMALTAPGRFWRFDEELGTFKYRVAHGLHAAIRNTAYHLNPAPLWAALANPPDVLLLGGGWHQPTIFGAALLGRLRRRSRLVFWSEANRAAAVHDGGPVAAFRRFVLERADAFAIPGRVAEETIRDDWGVTGRPFLPLPNVVDERSVMRLASDPAARVRRRAEVGAGPDDVLFIWPARLHESMKGIINFLDAVRSAFTGREVIAIAGEGPDRATIESWLAQSGLQRVHLLGQQPEAAMMEWYGAADVLLLPSLRDPNPLSIVEGLWAGLPVLASRHCGNWPEAIAQGVNGWVVDPHDRASMVSAFRAAAAATKPDLARMGEASRQVARERFATDLIVRRFADAVSQLAD